MKHAYDKIKDEVRENWNSGYEFIEGAAEEEQKRNSWIMLPEDTNLVDARAKEKWQIY